MSREKAIEAATQAMGGTEFAQRLAEYLVDVVMPHLVTEIHHYDIEKRAEHFNEGYEAAMSQQLADDPSAAEEWLAVQKAKVLREWIAEWPTTPDDGTFLARVADDGLRRADLIERGEP